MLRDLGFNKQLYILAFDHRHSFISQLLDDNNDHGRVSELKQIIYNGFTKAVEKKLVPHSQAAILIDEEFGAGILQAAETNGHIRCLSVEKSGQTEFNFEYGDNFAEHIKKFNPEFVKALVRYNPAGDQELNIRQQARLKILNDWCHRSSYKFILEVLIDATKEEMVEDSSDKQRFDEDSRPYLSLQMVRELHGVGVDPDVWKMEGFVREDDYKNLVGCIKSEGRDNVSLVILGRGAQPVQVERWLRVGAGVKGIIGFAIGRTIFWQALKDYLSGNINDGQAAEIISQNYAYFYKIFKENI